jgi:hypothetical protein
LDRNCHSYFSEKGGTFNLAQKRSFPSLCALLLSAALPPTYFNVLKRITHLSFNKKKVNVQIEPYETTNPH